MNSAAHGFCPHTDNSRDALEQREEGFPTGRSAGWRHCGPCDPSFLLPQCCSGPQSPCLHLQCRPVSTCVPTVLSHAGPCAELFRVHESKTFEEVRPEGKASGMEVVQGANCSIGHPRETSWAGVLPHTRAERISSRTRCSLHVVPFSLHTQPLAGMVSVHTPQFPSFCLPLPVLSLHFSSLPSSFLPSSSFPSSSFSCICLPVLGQKACATVPASVLPHFPSCPLPSSLLLSPNHNPSPFPSTSSCIDRCALDNGYLNREKGLHSHQPLLQRESWTLGGQEARSFSLLCAELQTRAAVFGLSSARVLYPGPGAY